MSKIKEFFKKNYKKANDFICNHLLLVIISSLVIFLLFKFLRVSGENIFQFISIFFSVLIFIGIIYFVIKKSRSLLENMTDIVLPSVFSLLIGLFFISLFISNDQKILYERLTPILAALGGVSAAWGAFYAVKKSIDMREKEKNEEIIVKKIDTMENIVTFLNSQRSIIKGNFNHYLKTSEDYKLENKDEINEIIDNQYDIISDFLIKKIYLKNINFYLAVAFKEIIDLLEESKKISEKHKKILSEIYSKMKQQFKNQNKGISCVSSSPDFKVLNDSKNEEEKKIKENLEKIITLIKNLIEIIAHFISTDTNVLFPVLNDKEILTDYNYSKKLIITYLKDKYPDKKFHFIDN